MEPEGSLPYSQVPVTCLCPEPARSSHTPTSYFLKIHPPIYALFSQMVSFPQVSPPKACISLSPPPCVSKAKSHKNATVEFQRKQLYVITTNTLFHKLHVYLLPQLSSVEQQYLAMSSTVFHLFYTHAHAHTHKHTHISLPC